MTTLLDWSRFRRADTEPRQGAARSVTLHRISTVTGILGLVLLTTVIVFAAWNERRTLFREAQEHARDSAFFLADHAERLFEVSDVALGSTILATKGLDWDAIETSEPLFTTLRNSNTLLPYVEDLWLNDATGKLRLTTFKFPAPYSNASDRSIFLDVKSATDHLVIGDRIVGRVTNQPTFMVGRRLTNPDGSFRGMVSATLDLSYFTSYWRRLELPNGERIAVVNEASGKALLVSDDNADPPPPQGGWGNLLAVGGQHSEAGEFQPARDTFGFYHRVADLPLFVTVEFARASVDEEWRVWVLRLAPLAAAAFLTLFSVMMLGRRQGRQEMEAAHDLAMARAALETANQHLEERVASRTADLRESNEEIQRFAYIVGHDLRSPLVNITGFTSELEDLRPALFAEGSAGAPSPAHRDFDEAIGFIRSSIDKMDRLINAILALSREGRRNFQPETIDTAALLREIRDSVAHRLQMAGATMTIEPLPALRTDRIAAEQIFSNLVDNAVKYLRKDVVGDIVVSGQRFGNRCHFRVADNGRGIDMKDRARVFELFRRAGPQDQPGEGIGLAHVKAMLRRLGGTIALESTPGQGCIFTVNLPDLDESAPVNKDA